MAIGGLSASNSATYGQVFLCESSLPLYYSAESIFVAISILYMLWIFLFGHFDLKESIDHQRLLFWEGVHLPLHFGLLLLLAAIVVSFTLHICHFAMDVDLCA
jgi:hypothetical protein